MSLPCLVALSEVSDHLISEDGLWKSQDGCSPIAGDGEEKNYMQPKQKMMLLVCGDMIRLSR